MKLRMINVFLILLLPGLQWYTGAVGLSHPTKEQKPGIRLTDDLDRTLGPRSTLKPVIKEFGISDSLFGSFFNLEAEKKYHLSIKRDNKEISNVCLRSDKIGVISTCALWWDMGFNYDTNDGQKGIDPDFANQTYSFSMRDDSDNLVFETPIPVSKSTSRGYIYTCDKEGNPKNAFIPNKDDVYLRGGNLQEMLTGKNQQGIEQDMKDRKLYIYVVTDRWSWRFGDRLDGKDFLKQKYVETLSGGALKSPQMIWQSDDLEVGSYDIIVSCRNLGILFDSDLIRSNYGVGFKVIAEPDKKKEQPEKKHDIIQELACQAPPHILMFGNLDQPHKAIYKDYFSPVEEIWVAVETLNPTPRQREAQKVRIYVVKHHEGKTLKDGDELHDDSGGYEDVLLQPECAHAVFTRVWCKPGIREEGYDVVIDFKNSNGRFGTYDKGLDILDNGIKMADEEKVAGKHMVNGKEVEHGGFYVPKQWVCLESVSLNHTRKAICSDAITIKYRLMANLRIPEWVRGKRSFPAAYVKNSRITVHPKFIASVDVDAAKFEAYTNSGNLTDVIEAYTDFYKTDKEKPDNSTYQLPYNVSSYRESNRGYLLQVRHITPGRIQSFYQQWDWYLKGIKYPYDEAIHIGSTINKIYIVLGVPQYPWTLEGDTAPWSDILDMCCQVAYGESEPESAAKKITQFLYREVGAKYQPSDGYSAADEASSDFQLEKFFNSIPTVGPANCYDMGKALVTFGNVLGCNLTLRYCDPFGKLNCIKPAGGDWDCTKTFDNHAFASIGDNVFDASLKVDSWGNPGVKPYRAAWMIDVPWCNYTQMVVKKGENPPPYPQVVLFKIEK